SCCAATWSSAWIASAVASRTRPASVRVTPRVLRCTSTAPAPRSRAAICWDTADGVWCSTAAAPAKLPAAATSRSTARRCPSINSSPNDVPRILPLPLMPSRPEAGLMTHMNRQEQAGAGLAAGSVLLVGGSVAASSLLGGYPVLGGQAIRYLAAGLLLAAWARLRRTPLPRPTGRDWGWLAALPVIGPAGGSVLLIEATQVAPPPRGGIGMGGRPPGPAHRRRAPPPPPPHPPGPVRRSPGHRRIRRGPARRRYRTGLERNRAAAVGRGARRRRRHIPAGRTGA